MQLQIQIHIQQQQQYVKQLDLSACTQTGITLPSSFPSLLQLHGLCIRWQIKRNWSLIHIRVHTHTYIHTSTSESSSIVTDLECFSRFFVLPPSPSLSRCCLLFFIFSHLSDTLYLLLAKGLMSEQLFLDLHGAISDNVQRTTNKQATSGWMPYPIENLKVSSAFFFAFYWRFIILMYTSICVYTYIF